MSTQTKLKDLEKSLNEDVFERHQENHTAILALLARKHHFQVGPPGTAKSMLVSLLSKRIADFPNDGYFHWLVTRYTNPSELYGPPDLALLKEGTYQLNTAGKLPRAHIAFIDEIFKGNSSILNANLTIMNERLFFNGGLDPKVPLISMFAASNEMPQGEELGALWDRLHFRHEVEPIQETSNFIKMLQKGPIDKTKKLVTLQEILDAHAEVDAVKIPDLILDTFKSLRQNMETEGLIATERRWVDCISIVQAEAWLHGRKIADTEDMRPLMHVLWMDLKDQKAVKKLVLDLANPIDRDLGYILENVTKLETQLNEAIEKADSNKTLSKSVVEIHGKLKKAKKEMQVQEKKATASGVESEVLPVLKGKLKQVIQILVDKGFGMDGGENIPTAP